MLHPLPMTRLFCAVPTPKVKLLVDALYEMKRTQLIDLGVEAGGIVRRGDTREAFPASELLLRLRTIISQLRLQEMEDSALLAARPAPAEEVSRDIQTTVDRLEKEFRVLKEEQDVIRNETKNLETQVDAVKPFVPFGLPLELLRGYQNLTVFFGKTLKAIDANGLEQVSEVNEVLIKDARFVLVFVEKSSAAKMQERLAQASFQPVQVPDGVKGTPEQILSELSAKLDVEAQRQHLVSSKMMAYSKINARWIFSAEEYLGILEEKAVSRAEFLQSEYTTVIEAWMPEAGADKVEATLKNLIGETLVIVREAPEEEHGHGHDHAAQADEEKAAGPKRAPGALRAPTALKNPSLFRPYEVFTETYGTPHHREIDPTILFGVMFTLFFGFMIGDAGYGLMATLLGAFIWRRNKKTKHGGVADFGCVVMYCGLAALGFGLWPFGDAFGIPFVAHEEGALSWSHIFNVHLWTSAIHKTDASSVSFILTMTILMGAFHLILGHIFGIINDRGHMKHTVARIGWLLLTIFFLAVIMSQPDQATCSNNGSFPIGPWFWAIMPSSMTLYLVLGAIGAVLVLATEGALVILEIFNPFVNTLSYTRIGALAIAKACLAASLNQIIAPIFNGTTGIIIGIFIAILIHSFLLFLGVLSSGIQALRLHYFEMYSKFFKGGGSKFVPFGHSYKFIQPVKS